MTTVHETQANPQVDSLDPATRWAASARGRRLVTIERQEVTRELPGLFGRHFLQIGQWGGTADWLASAEMLHRAVLSIGPQGAGQARVDPLQLPLAAASIDAILLPHTLEFAASPHALLREVSRVLTDRGRLLILGFNPWSLLGCRRWLGLAPRALPTDAHFYPPGRLCDWLKLLDFEITSVRRYGAGFPWLAPRGKDQMFTPATLLQPLQEAYLIAGRKRVAPLTMIGRVQRAQVKPLIAVPVANAVRQEAEPQTPKP